MSKNLFKAKFDPSAEYVVRRAFGDYDVGDKFVKKDFTERRIRLFYENRMIVMEDVWNEFVGAPSPAADKRRVADYPAPVSDAPHSDLQPLRDELEAAGVSVDKRWGEKRLNEELEKATRPALPGVTDGAA